jgi:hypothetical protein
MTVDLEIFSLSSRAIASFESPKKRVDARTISGGKHIAAAGNEEPTLRASYHVRG